MRASWKATQRLLFRSARGSGGKIHTFSVASTCNTWSPEQKELNEHKMRTSKNSLSHQRGIRPQGMRTRPQVIAKRSKVSQSAQILENTHQNGGHYGAFEMGVPLFITNFNGTLAYKLPFLGTSIGGKSPSVSMHLGDPSNIDNCRLETTNIPQTSGRDVESRITGWQKKVVCIALYPLVN